MWCSLGTSQYTHRYSSTTYHTTYKQNNRQLRRYLPTYLRVWFVYVYYRVSNLFGILHNEIRSRCRSRQLTCTMRTSKCKIGLVHTSSTSVSLSNRKNPRRPYTTHSEEDATRRKMGTMSGANLLVSSSMRRDATYICTWHVSYLPTYT